MNKQDINEISRINSQTTKGCSSPSKSSEMIKNDSTSYFLDKNSNSNSMSQLITSSINSSFNIPQNNISNKSSNSDTLFEIQKD